MRSHFLLVAALALVGCSTDVVVGQERQPPLANTAGTPPGAQVPEPGATLDAGGASGAQGPDAGEDVEVEEEAGLDD